MEIAGHVQRTFVPVTAQERIMGIKEAKSFRPRRIRQSAVCLDNPQKGTHAEELVSGL
jgi:hypothetical protein